MNKYRIDIAEQTGQKINVSLIHSVTVETVSVFLAASMLESIIKVLFSGRYEVRFTRTKLDSNAMQVVVNIIDQSSEDVMNLEYLIYIQ